jgi:hypothetical protein
MRKHYYEVCVNNGSMYAHDSRSSARQAFKALGLDSYDEKRLFNLV